MKPATLVPRAMLERKPPHGAPCNQCGLCCVATKCDLGKRLFGSAVGPCPALEPDGEEKYRCGVIAATTDKKLHDAALIILRVGEGCDARFNGEWINHEFHAKC